MADQLDRSAPAAGIPDYGLDEHHPRWSAAWWRAWKTEHMLRYPDLDQVSIDNINASIHGAERREAAREESDGH